MELTVKRVVLCGWNVGFDKVGHTKLLRVLLGYSLAGAKSATDAVLSGEEVVLDVPDDQYSEIIAEFTRLGARVALELRS